MTQIRGHTHLLLPVLVARGNDQVGKPYNILQLNQQYTSVGLRRCYLANEVKNASCGMYVSSNARSHRESLERSAVASSKICWNM